MAHALQAKQAVMQRLAEGGDGGGVLTIPQSVHDSYDGHLIQVKHYYKVEGTTGSSWMSNPTIGAQVFIQGVRIPNNDNPHGVSAEQRLAMLAENADW